MQSLLSDYTYRFLALKDAWHLAYYIPEQREDMTTLSGKLVQFKEYDLNITKGWIRWSIDSFKEKSLKYDYIIRALGHAELIASGKKPLDLLGHHLANNICCTYAPFIVKKNRVTKALHFLKLDERKAEIHEAYEVADNTIDLNQKKILIIDDIGTTNTTISEIMRAIRVAWPKVQFSYFCLGRTNHTPTANDSIPLTYFT